MSEQYFVGVWTAGTKEYATEVLDWLDPTGKLQFRLFRDSCTALGDGTYTKDLSLLGQDMSQTIIVDNSPRAFELNEANAIQCIDFIDDQLDQELLRIAEFLVRIKDHRDVREVCQSWRTYEPTLSGKKRKCPSTFDSPPSKRRQIERAPSNDEVAIDSTVRNALEPSLAVVRIQAAGRRWLELRRGVNQKEAATALQRVVRSWVVRRILSAQQEKARRCDATL